MRHMAVEMSTHDNHEARAVARRWLKERTRPARRAALPAILVGLADVLAAIGQAWCAALVLSGGSRVEALVGFGVLAVLRAGLGVVAEGAAFASGAAGRRRLRSEVLSAVLFAPMSVLRNTRAGETAAALFDRIEAMDGYFARYLPQSTLAVAGPAIVALAVCAVDPFAALIFVGVGALVPLGMAAAGIGAAAASRRQFAAMARLQARFLDRMRGIATIIMHGRAEDEAAALGTSADELRRRTMRVLRVAFLSSAMLDCAVAAALVVLALRAVSGGVGAADALYELLLVPVFFAPLRAYALAYQDRMQAAGAADALVRIPAAPAPVVAAPAVRTVSAHGVAVAFEDVRFTWDPARGPALDGLSFRVPAGETLVLAGPSGAGKSTVIEILLGFARPDSGRVTLNGADIADIVPQALARMTAWIGQRPVLFAASLRDNILLARPEASEAEIVGAARAAHVDRFAEALPQGLDTLIGEGGYGLSGGQAQRVAIARAFLKNAPLLLLDEPTAHLDPVTEAEVLDSLRRLTIGRTVVMASHSAAARAWGGRRLDLREGRAEPARGVA